MHHTTFNKQEILNDTRNAFTSSPELMAGLKKATEFIDEKQYKRIHTQPLRPTSLTINVDDFEDQIQNYDNWFEQWGKTFSELPRKGLALVNTDGKLKHGDPVNRSLYEWSIDNPHNPIFEWSCTEHTEVMEIPSLDPLYNLDPHWCRSNILKWSNGAWFYPHVDTLVTHFDNVPCYNLRLWGTTTNDIVMGFDDGNQRLVQHNDVEPGRLYLLDSSIVHTAECIGKTGYQFFLALLPSAYNKIQDYLI